MAQQLARRQRPRWLLAGRYRMEEVIGRGGMSTVYRATDTVLHRDVAVKVLLAALAQHDPTHVARFEREARAVAALRHPAVVKVYDTGIDRGAHFIVMEYVAGRGLDEVIRTGPLEPREAARIGARVAEAVAAAHSARILHRDIKPANVMVGTDGAVKVLDFGIARTVQETTITHPAFAIGTAAYMPPERVLGRPGDERSDVYSLGCLLYALLTGHPPFMAEEPVAILHQQVHAEPQRPSKAGARVPPGLERLVLAMLAKDPDDRPQTASEVGGLLSTASRALAHTPPVPSRTSGRTRALPRSRRPNRRLTAGVLAAAAAVMIGAILALSSAGGSQLPFRLGRALTPRVNNAARASHASSRTASSPASPGQTAAGGVVEMAPNQPAAPAAAPPPPGQAKKEKPPKPPGHGAIPPGHGGTPPGQEGKPPKHGGGGSHGSD